MFGIFWAGVAACAVAQDAAEDARGALEAAQAHLEAGEHEKALAQFRIAFREDPGNTDVNFGLGMAAAALGDYETSCMAFDRVLIMNPEMTRVKLELGRSYFQLRLYPVAEQYFVDALEDGVPPNVRANVEGFLRDIRRTRKAHFITGTLTLSASKDSNARVSPAGDVELGDFPISVPVVKDELFSTSLVLNHTYRPRAGQRWNWSTTLVNYNAVYDKETDLDVDYLNLLVGPGLLVGSGIVDLHGVAVYMDKDYLGYLRALGAEVGARFPLNQSVWLALSARGEDRKYYQTPDNTGFNSVCNAGANLTFGRNTLAASAGYEVNTAHDDAEAYDRVIWSLRCDRDLPMGMAVYCGYKHEYTKYDRAGDFSASRRADDVAELSLGLRKRIFGRWSAEFSHKHTNSWSNVGLYDYDRDVTSVSVSYRF